METLLTRILVLLLNNPRDFFLVVHNFNGKFSKHIVKALNCEISIS